jgi:hypothetical protein
LRCSENWYRSNIHSRGNNDGTYLKKILDRGNHDAK